MRKGLTKQYLAYKPVGNFGIIASGRANISFLTYKKIEGRYVVSGAGENAYIWDTRLSQKVLELHRNKEEVSYVCPSPNKYDLAVGYVDGQVEIFDLDSGNSKCSFSLHKNAVNVLKFDSDGLRLLSGGLDTEILVIDLVAQKGICRLSGHTGAITDLCFLNSYEGVVVSSSKDTQIKFWNIETRCCFTTLVDHRTDVWGIELMRNDEFLVTGTSDSLLRVFRLAENPKYDAGTIGLNIIDSENEIDDSASPIKITFVGSIQRAGRGRTMNLVSDVDGNILACHGSDSLIEIFSFCSAEEAAKRLAKRMKKLKLKENSESQVSHTAALTDEVKRLSSIKTDGKIKSMHLIMGVNGELRISVSFAENYISLYSINVNEKKAEPKLLRSIRQHGHHSEIRTVCFSSDAISVATGSGSELKLWNRDSKQCLRTINDTGYALCSSFIPGDRYILVGLKSGHLLIVDISTSEIIEDIAAHDSELWSICLLPNLKGCATAGTDKTIKTWQFELVANTTDDHGQKTLSLLHTNTLQLEEPILSIKISANNKFIAAALLDNTVKVFFFDTLKFYLSLYGHKLPVLCLDISSDSTLIATGSSDRNVKIWGLDFGDCHKSLFAHDDSVTGLQFIPKTHMFFTCGKDGKIKQWDGDSFVKIITLPGHIGEAHGLAVSANGMYLATCGADRIIRMFERTMEPLVLQDVQEEEREAMENRTLATGEETVVPGLPGLKLASKKTVGAEKVAELIIECLDVCQQFDSEPGTKKEIPALMRAYDAGNSIDFLANVLNTATSNDLEEALVLLPFSYVVMIMNKIPTLVDTHKNNIELFCKVTIFLFRIHHKLIVSSEVLLPVIGQIIEKIQDGVNNMRDIVGFNYHSLQYIQREVESTNNIELFSEVSKSKKQNDKKAKDRALLKRAHIQITG